LVQLAPGASGPHVLAVLANELAFAPVMVVAAVKLTAADVLFVSVITCVAAAVPTGVEGNVKDGVIVRPVLALVPVPVRLTVCGVVEPESV